MVRKTIIFLILFLSSIGTSFSQMNPDTLYKGSISIAFEPILYSYEVDTTNGVVLDSTAIDPEYFIVFRDTATKLTSSFNTGQLTSKDFTASELDLPNGVYEVGYWAELPGVASSPIHWSTNQNASWTLAYIQPTSVITVIKEGKFIGFTLKP